MKTIDWQGLTLPAGLLHFVIRDAVFHYESDPHGRNNIKKVVSSRNELLRLSLTVPQGQFAHFLLTIPGIGRNKMMYIFDQLEKMDDCPRPHPGRPVSSTSLQEFAGFHIGDKIRHASTGSIGFIHRFIAPNRVIVDTGLPKRLSLFIKNVRHFDAPPDPVPVKAPRVYPPWKFTVRLTQAQCELVRSWAASHGNYEITEAIHAAK